MRRVLYFAAMGLLFFAALINVQDSRSSIFLESGTSIKGSKELLPYAKRYFKMLDDHNIKYDKSQPILIVFNRYAKGQILGIAYGMFNNDYVNIHINQNAWGIMTAEERLITMFHELSHDVFNIEHGTMELMQPVKPYNPSIGDFNRMTKELVKYLQRYA